MTARERADVRMLSTGLVAHGTRSRHAVARLAALLEQSLPVDDVRSAVSHSLNSDVLLAATAAEAADPAAAAPTSAPPEYRVFRRESPVLSPLVARTVPEWARGAAVAETIGPISSVDGRVFWYDFYRIVRLIPVCFAGDAQPAFLFHLTERRFALAETVDMHDILGLLRQNTYRLQQGSVWVRANLLAAGAPAASYIGLTIRDGSLTFTPQVVVQNNRLTIPAGGACSIHLDLQSPAAPAFGGGASARDAAAAMLTPPDRVTMSLSAGSARITTLGDAGWTLYGQAVGFVRDANTAASWEASLNAVLVPYRASVERVVIGAVQSPFALPAGQADVERAGWALPVAMIDVANPVEASGIGGLAIRTRSGLTLTWRGLQQGPITLAAPWFMLQPGLILLTDTAARGATATQKLRLWQESAPPGRSTVDLRFARAGVFSYLASTTGYEGVFAVTDTGAQIDRPVDVRGTPFSAHTLTSQLTIVHSDPQRSVMLHDDNMLTDALAREADWPVTPGATVSLAIRNALFTITPVNSLLLFGILRSDELLERGTLWLGFGLYSVLPTLPDPYAANLRPLPYARANRVRRPMQLLLAAVTWQKAIDDMDSDAITTAFSFAPIGTQAEALAAWSIAGANSAERGAAALQPSSAAPQNPGGVAFARRQPVESVWRGLFDRFGAEQFSLLDVSSNADQMGVSFSYFDPQRVERDQSPFGDVYGGGAPAPANPVEVRELDLSAQNRFVRAFTLPQVSWEPIFNLTEPDRAGDPPATRLLFPNDGGPTRLLNDDTTVVPIAPIPVTHRIVADFLKRGTGFTGAIFTLPYGLRAFAQFTRVNQPAAGKPASHLAFNQPIFEAGAMVGGLQLRVDAPPQSIESPMFRGCTVQVENLLDSEGNPTGAGTLGASVGTIFNEEFFLDGPTHVRNRGVPVTRIDFSGYGTSLFSHWEAPNAAIASTSQARFHVFTGRTAHEVIQVRTLMYPWGIHVVRTITLFRTSSGYTFRTDSGWQPESSGLFDFSWTAKVEGPPDTEQRQASPYEFHPGVVRGVFNVRNIRETDAIAPFKTAMNIAIGNKYVDQDNYLRVVDASTPPSEQHPAVELQAVYFDGDFGLDDVVAGSTGGRVQSKGILGFVQLKPRGEPLTAEAFRDLLNANLGSIGGAIACEVNIAASGQHLRASRVDVSPSVAGDGVSPIFVVAARGAAVLPAGGAWSVVKQDVGSGAVTAIDANATVPLIRRGALTDPKTHTTNATAADLFRIADPIDLVRAPVANTRNFGFLQTTGTQKTLFRLPSFQQGVDQLLGAAPDFADAYRLINTKGIFPNVQDAVPLALGAFKTRIIAEGYTLRDEANPGAILRQVLPAGPLKLIDESYLKIYVDYKFDANAANGTPARAGTLDFSLDSAAAEGRKWLSNVGDIAMVVDLGPIKRLVTIKGSFEAKHGEAAGFRTPELVFADELKPVVDILTLLTELQGGDYAAAMQKGLDVAMSNSAESWTYAFHARKEFPVVQFPPGEAYYAPQVPLKLQASFALGAYFNEALTPTTDAKQLVPTAGAYLEFGGSLSVMCVSVAAATVYAVGAVNLRVSGDTKAGPGLAMKFGFGAEVVVGLPVVGNVSILFMVGIEVSIDLTQISVTAFLLFRGRAELLGGIVCITIQIEAKGTYKRLTASGTTNMQAQVTFSIDVSIFLIINLHFSQSWQEQRQIA